MPWPDNPHLLGEAVEVAVGSVSSVRLMDANGQIARSIHRDTQILSTWQDHQMDKLQQPEIEFS